MKVIVSYRIANIIPDDVTIDKIVRGFLPMDPSFSRSMSRGAAEVMLTVKDQNIYSVSI